MKNKLIHIAILLIIGTLTAVLDLYSKERMIDIMSAYDRNTIEVTSFFNIILVYNKGISFGMFNEAQYSQWLFITLTCAIMFAMLCWLWFAKNILTVSAISLIIGGAVGNLINRLQYGAVVDFLDFHIGLWHYPAFNIADAAICIGVFLLLFFSEPRAPSR